MKTDTLCVATRRPGTCATCRHANQETADFREGHVFCQWEGKPKQLTQQCDVRVALARAVGGKTHNEYFMYEPFDGKNCTWTSFQGGRIMAEDAEPALRAELHADEPEQAQGVGARHPRPGSRVAPFIAFDNRRR